MGRVKEAHVVKQINASLTASGLYFINHHGSQMSRSGVPDFITMDASCRFVGIEAKAPGAKPTVNQFRQALSILQSGGRYIIAYDGFDASVLDTSRSSMDLITCPYITWTVTGLEHGCDEFDTHDSFQPRRSGVVELMRPRLVRTHATHLL